ncbi:hypothetical protein O181_114145 [Austropuccinia psidii MF-1]|uniref:RAVE complex protein Rav1 C-terminal domain-containing protein n=1 Tax=Austropuccinia psidii MF-1 TaxID=1389203 RepID=A0A9Q3PV82_9BASI|nr:hypothetical protein [Austropuccinia psidii MF-1]
MGVLFAQLCTCQHLLAQETMSLLKSYSFKQTGVGPQLSWNTARVIGLFLWLNSKEHIQLHLETIAQSEYVGGDHYIKNGLWRVAYSHPDRPHMLKFLQNNFSEPRWKNAAQKNAFALISQQHFFERKLRFCSILFPIG